MSRIYDESVILGRAVYMQPRIFLDNKKGSLSSQSPNDLLIKKPESACKDVIWQWGGGGDSPEDSGRLKS